MNSTLQSFAEETKKNGVNEFLNMFESLQGSKWLILGAQVRGILTYVIPETVLSENNVIAVRELSFLPDEENASISRSPPEHILYISRPILSEMKLIARHVRNFTASGFGRNVQFHLFFVPHVNTICEQVLEDEGVLEMINIEEMPIGFMPLDTDLYSLEMDSFFKQCIVDGDNTPIETVAKAIHKLQSMFGVIPNVRSKGTSSKKIIQKLLQLRQAEAAENYDHPASSLNPLRIRGDIHTLVLLDREVDMVSPLVTPLTYEGLVDELISINNGEILVDQSLMGDDEESDKKKNVAGSAKDVKDDPAVRVPRRPQDKTKMPIRLDSSDTIFCEIRGENRDLTYSPTQPLTLSPTYPLTYSPETRGENRDLTNLLFRLQYCTRFVVYNRLRNRTKFALFRCKQVSQLNSWVFSCRKKQLKSGRVMQLSGTIKTQCIDT